jgi:hypothetical protein
MPFDWRGSNRRSEKVSTEIAEVSKSGDRAKSSSPIPNARRLRRPDRIDQAALAGLFLFVSTPETFGGYLPFTAKGEESANATDNTTSSESALIGYPPIPPQCDLVATLQCGPNFNIPIPRQDSECAYGNSFYGGRDYLSPLGNEYALNLERCVVRERSDN